jgi:transposase
MVKQQGKRKYTAEFRESAVRLVMQEKMSVGGAAADLGMPATTLQAWLNQARKGTGVFTPRQERDRDERMRQLEAENRRLRIERDILKKATAYFAKEQL